jgi:hypothetical protein
MEMVEYLVSNWAVLASILFSVHALAVLIVNLTPTPGKYAGVLATVYTGIELVAGLVTKEAKDTGDAANDSGVSR